MTRRALSSAGFIIFATAIISCKATPKADTAAVPPPDSSTVATPATVTITASDYAFDLPAEVPAGAVVFHLVNQGKEMHHAQVVRLDEGKTLTDFSKAMAQSGPPPTWVKFVGGPNGIVPGQAADGVVLLTPGQYAIPSNPSHE